MNRGKELKFARIKANIKALDLSQKLNVSPTLLSLVENGYRKCSDDLYKRSMEIIKKIR